MQTEIDILTKRLQRVPWGETGVPEALAGLLQPAVSRRVDGGGGRVAFQLLAGLGISGWSARLDVQTAVNGLRQISQANGTYGRAWHLLQAAGLYETHTASFGLRPFVLARLTPLGRTLLTQAGVEVVTVEPGVYLPGLWGIRIEDTVLVREEGCEILTQTSKDLTIL